MRARGVLPLLVLVGLVGLVAGACATAEGSARSAASAGTVPTRERVEPAADAPVAEVVTGIDTLTFELLRRAGDGNVVLSPASFAVAFAVASAGAVGETRDRLAQAFGFPDEPALHEAVNALVRALEAADAHEEVDLTLANAAWAQAGHPIEAEFLDALGRHYGAALRTLDLDGDPEGSRAEINRWVAEVTRDLVPEVVPEGFIRADTVFVLANALYLKALWEQPFGAHPTVPEAFTRSDGTTVQADTMRQAHLRSRYLVEEGLAAVELPYKGGQLSMVVLVPEGDPERLEAGLDAAEWARITGALRDGTVDLSLPRWDVTTELDLAGPLGELGVDIPGGDYSGIAPGLFLDAAVHGATISVDEEGTEAAAATALGFAASAPPPADVVIRADRPFLYAVQHGPSGLVLFAGRVVDPTA